MSKISPCLWFDGEAEEAARFYVSQFPDSRIDRVQENVTEGCRQDVERYGSRAHMLPLPRSAGTC